MEGWIKLHRQIIESPVFAHQTALKIWVWCLCKASHSGKSFPISTGKGETIVTIERGQFIFGRFKAEEELGINGSTVYKWMHKFSDEMDMINIESNSHYSVITILNFNDFQDIETDKITPKEQPSNKQVTSKEQPSNTYKNDKNVKNEEKENRVFCIGSDDNNRFVIIQKYINDPIYKVFGVSGMKELLEMNRSKLPQPEYAEKFLRDKDGNKYDDWGHLLNSYKLFIKDQFK